MANNRNQASAHRLTTAAIAFAVGFGLHGIDHLPRGMAASPTAVMIGGLVQGVFVVIAVLLVLRHHRRAAELPSPWDSVARRCSFTHISCRHFCRRFKTVSSPARCINVTWFSWLTAVAEIGTALIFGFAGLRTLRGGSEASMHESMEIHSPLT